MKKPEPLFSIGYDPACDPTKEDQYILTTSDRRVLEGTIMNILHTAREREPEQNPTIFSTKLGEEFGEFCEQVLHVYGFNSHKNLDDELLDEAADVIQLVLIVLQKSYPEKTPTELFTELETSVAKKFDKYITILEKHEKAKADARRTD